jgi:heme a synthase
MTPEATSVPPESPRAAHPAAPSPDGSPDGGTDWRTAIPEARRRPVRIWLWSVAGMTLLTLIVGGITRLTQSGLSIVDWAPLMGVVPPLNDVQWQEAFDAYRASPEYLELRRGMSMEEFRFIFFWEYLHRLVARAIGLVFLVPFLVFWMRGWLSRPLLFRALALFGLGAAQGAMGWFMVRSGLVDVPRVSHYRLAAHLSLAFVIFGYALWLARDLALETGSLRPRMEPATRRFLLRGLAAVGVLLGVQIVWGAFVAGLKAGFQYNTFPLMAGGILPPDFLRLEPALANLVENPAAVQWMHRFLGTALLVASGYFWWRARAPGTGANPLDRFSGRMNTLLFGGIAGQYLLGVATLLLVVPVWLGVTHQAVAMLLVGIWLAWIHHVRNARPERA